MLSGWFGDKDQRWNYLKRQCFMVLWSQFLKERMIRFVAAPCHFASVNPHQIASKFRTLLIKSELNWKCHLPTLPRSGHCDSRIPWQTVMLIHRLVILTTLYHTQQLQMPCKVEDTSLWGQSQHNYGQSKIFPDKNAMARCVCVRVRVRVFQGDERNSWGFINKDSFKALSRKILLYFWQPAESRRHRRHLQKPTADHRRLGCWLVPSAQQVLLGLS